MTSNTPPSRLAIVLAFGSVYLCWGANYGAMSIGVRLLPATILAGMRMSIGALIMLSFCALRAKQLFYSPSIMIRLAFLGLLLLFFGNIGLVWAEKYVPSGLAALLIAIVPVYVAVIESRLPGGEQLRPRGILGVILGFLALIALLWPGFHAALQTHGHSLPLRFIASVVILLGALSWACGSVLFRRMQLPVDPLVAAGWEMLAAGFCDLFCATVAWQWPHAVWNTESVSAIGYLVLFGSLMGFSCYIWLIHNVPVAKVATYAYVNPVVAVIVGAAALGEQLQKTEYVGMVAVLCAVVLVTSSQMKSGRSAAEIEVGPVEHEA